MADPPVLTSIAIHVHSTLVWSSLISERINKEALLEDSADGPHLHGSLLG
jgi:hypothetical protein